MIDDRPAAPEPASAAAQDGWTPPIAVVAAGLAIAGVCWSGWQWWGGPEETPPSPGRVGVFFASVPVAGLSETSAEATGAERAAAEPGDSSDPTDANEDDWTARPGLLVVSIDAAGAAARSGVRPGDVWLSIGGLPLCDSDDRGEIAERLEILRAFLEVGFAFEATLLRGGELFALTIRDDAPASAGQGSLRPKWPENRDPDRGVMGVELLTTALVYPDDPPGVAISRVIPGGPADQAGVRVGDRLLAFRRDEATVEAERALAELEAAVRRVFGDDEPLNDVEQAGPAMPKLEMPKISEFTGLPPQPEPQPDSPYAGAAEARAGETVTLDLLRRGRPLSLPIRLVRWTELPRTGRQSLLEL
ncbi:MAG: PDZ domain-containing protein [Planctomycetota bacterium]